MDAFQNLYASAGLNSPAARFAGTGLARWVVGNAMRPASLYTATGAPKNLPGQGQRGSVQNWLTPMTVSLLAGAAAATLI